MTKPKRPRGNDRRTRVVKHYAYRMDHDTGFAPHVSPDARQCALCGCSRTIEHGARPGSWIIGIGGNDTNKPDALIYAMEVQSTPTVAELLRQFPDDAYVRDLRQRMRGCCDGSRLNRADPALVSQHFYYFGDQAGPLPKPLRELRRAEGSRPYRCKIVSEQEVLKLLTFLAKRRPPGVYGLPNNSSKYQCDPRRTRARFVSTGAPSCGI
jgi:hypothetical protein